MSRVSGLVHSSGARREQNESRSSDRSGQSQREVAERVGVRRGELVRIRAHERQLLAELPEDGGERAEPDRQTRAASDRERVFLGAFGPEPHSFSTRVLGLAGRGSTSVSRRSTSDLRDSLDDEPGSDAVSSFAMNFGGGASGSGVSTSCSIPTMKRTAPRTAMIVPVTADPRLVAPASVAVDRKRTDDRRLNQRCEKAAHLGGAAL